MSRDARDFWEGRYGYDEGIAHHAEQNHLISRDFLAEARGRGGATWEAVAGARRVFEFGCGTGDLAALLHREFRYEQAVGVDLSGAAVEAARAAHGEGGVEFRQQGGVGPADVGGFDLAICSNTLEHFQNPWSVLDDLLRCAPQVLVLVPYAEPVTDGYESEGGAGHVFTFTEESFRGYRLVEWFRFQTGGWQHSSGGEEPWQMVALVEAG